MWDEFVSNGKEPICYTHEEIAKLIGSAREVVSRVLKYMAEDQVITLQRGKIILTDMERLKEYL